MRRAVINRIFATFRSLKDFPYSLESRVWKKPFPRKSRTLCGGVSPPPGKSRKKSEEEGY